MQFPQPAGAEPTTAAATLPWCSFGGYFNIFNGYCWICLLRFFWNLIAYFVWELNLKLDVNGENSAWRSAL
jgi:hypothetical protein